MVVWEASRGFGGKSLLLSALALVEMLTLGANIRIIGGSGEQAARVNEYIRGQNPRTRGQFWDAPLAPTHLLGVTTQTSVNTTNGGHAKALMASPTSIRGAHPERLKIDEADEMDLDLFHSAQGQTMGTSKVTAQTTISSTHHHSDGTMTYIKQQCREKGWSHFSWCLYESMEPHGWLPQEEIERKRSEVSERMFEIEYLLQEPHPEGRVFTDEVLANLFDKSLGVYDGRVGEEIRVVPPGNNREFFTGADWARKEDFTVLHTNMRSKTGPDLLAAWQRTQRLPWPIIVPKLDARLNAYGGSSMHDETGIGDVIQDYLNSDSEGFNFSRQKESWEMYNSYVAAVEAGELAYPLIEPLYRAHKFATVDELFGPEHVSDEIVAAALAWRAREFASFNLLLSRL